jgi:hypothetical protein
MTKALPDIKSKLQNLVWRVLQEIICRLPFPPTTALQEMRRAQWISRSPSFRSPSVGAEPHVVLLREARRRSRM